MILSNLILLYRYNNYGKAYYLLTKVPEKINTIQFFFSKRKAIIHNEFEKS